MQGNSITHLQENQIPRFFVLLQYFDLYYIDHEVNLKFIACALCQVHLLSIEVLEP